MYELLSIKNNSQSPKISSKTAIPKKIYLSTQSPPPSTYFLTPRRRFPRTLVISRNRLALGSTRSSAAPAKFKSANAPGPPLPRKTSDAQLLRSLSLSQLRSASRQSHFSRRRSARSASFPGSELRRIVDVLLVVVEKQEIYK